MHASGAKEKQKGGQITVVVLTEIASVLSYTRCCKYPVLPRRYPSSGPGESGPSTGTLFLLVLDAFHIFIWHSAHIHYPIEDIVAVVSLHHDLLASACRLGNTAARCNCSTRQPSTDPSSFSDLIHQNHPTVIVQSSRNESYSHFLPNSLATFFKSIPCASNPDIAVTYFLLFLSTRFMYTIASFFASASLASAAAAFASFFFESFSARFCASTESEESDAVIASVCFLCHQ